MWSYFSPSNDKSAKIHKPSDEPLTISRRPVGAVCQVGVFFLSLSLARVTAGRLLAIFCALVCCFLAKMEFHYRWPALQPVSRRREWFSQLYALYATQEMLLQKNVQCWRREFFYSPLQLLLSRGQFWNAQRAIINNSELAFYVARAKFWWMAPKVEKSFQVAALDQKIFLIWCHLQHFLTHFTKKIYNMAGLRKYFVLLIIAVQRLHH